MHSHSLLPLRDLRPLLGDADRWEATGCEAQFAVPCNLPGGWVRIRVRLHSDVRGRMEWYVLDAAGEPNAVPFERTDYYGTGEREFFIYLPRPVSALRFDPLDVPGTFRIEELHIKALSKVQVLFLALGTKLALLWRYRRLLPALHHGSRMLLHGEFRTIGRKLFAALARPTFQAAVPYDANVAYVQWRQARQADLSLAAPPLADGPQLSLIVRVSPERAAMLDRTLTSVLHQTYPRWELLLCAEPGLPNALSTGWQREPRVRVAEVSGFLSEIDGDAFAFLDPGDALPADALLRMAEALQTVPSPGMVYSDEDRVLADGRHVDPIFKPAWSPELLLNAPYTGRLCFFRTKLLRQLGGVNVGAADVEHRLALRLAEAGALVGHIPDILYHRAKDSTPWPARARVRFPIDDAPKVSILIPTAYRTTGVGEHATTLLARCLGGIRGRSTYRNYEIIVVDNARPPAEVMSLFATMRVRRFAYALPFNWAAAMNQAAAQAVGEYLVLLDDDTEVLTPDWVEALLEYGQRPGVGAVGARLLFPDGRLQHAGVTLQHGHAIHPFAGLPGDHPGYLGSTLTPRNCSAVTSACMLTPTAVFRELDGFREMFALYYNDIDYCLRLRHRGWRVVYTPHATLHHYEAATKTAMRPRELQAFRELWADRLADDPFYNPNLSADFRDYRLETDPERIRQTVRTARYAE